MHKTTFGLAMLLAAASTQLSQAWARQSVPGTGTGTYGPSSGSAIVSGPFAVMQVRDAATAQASGDGNAQGWSAAGSEYMRHAQANTVTGQRPIYAPNLGLITSQQKPINYADVPSPPPPPPPKPDHDAHAVFSVEMTDPAGGDMWTTYVDVPIRGSSSQIQTFMVTDEHPYISDLHSSGQGQPLVATTSTVTTGVTGSMVGHPDQAGQVEMEFSVQLISLESLDSSKQGNAGSVAGSVTTKPSLRHATISGQAVLAIGSSVSYDVSGLYAGAGKLVFKRIEQPSQ